MIYSSWDIECDKLKLIIMGHFLPFSPTPPKNQKIWNFEKMKNLLDIIILRKCTKNHNHMRYGSWDIEWDTDFFGYFGLFFAILPHKTQKIKILKKWKWRCHNFTPMYQKSWSHDVCFLRYGVWQTIYCHSGPFFPLLPIY